MPSALPAAHLGAFIAPSAAWQRAVARAWRLYRHSGGAWLASTDDVKAGERGENGGNVRRAN